MRFTRRDTVATGLVAAVVLVYVAHVGLDGIPFVHDVSGMAAVGLILGFASRRVGGRVFAGAWIPAPRASSALTTMTIDHLVYGAPDLAAAVDDLAARFGVRAQPGGKHHGIGTRNALLALGPRTYLEVLAPDPDQPPPSNPLPFGIDELTSPRLVGWAVGCDDIDTAIAGARAAGYDPGDAIEMTRTGATGTVLRWRLTLNANAGGPVPFLIAWGHTEH